MGARVSWRMKDRRSPGVRLVEPETVPYPSMKAMSQKAATASGWRSNAPTCRARRSGAHRSSSSRKARYLPRLRAMPTLRATLTPALAWWMTTASGIPPTAASTAPGSGVPSSTTISSQSVKVWAASDARVSAR